MVNVASEWSIQWVSYNRSDANRLPEEYVLIRNQSTRSTDSDPSALGSGSACQWPGSSAIGLDLLKPVCFPG